MRGHVTVRGDILLFRLLTAGSPGSGVEQQFDDTQKHTHASHLLRYTISPRFSLKMLGLKPTRLVSYPFRFSQSKAHFSGVLGNGVLSTQKPSFPHLEYFGHCAEWTDSQFPEGPRRTKKTTQ